MGFQTKVQPSIARFTRVLCQLCILVEGRYGADSIPNLLQAQFCRKPFGRVGREEGGSGPGKLHPMPAPSAGPLRNLDPPTTPSVPAWRQTPPCSGGQCLRSSSEHGEEKIYVRKFENLQISASL